MEDLTDKVAFLRLWSPLNHPGNYRSYPDVFLVASDHVSPPVPAQKAVLASHSPVFKAMFENEMEESQSGRINISNVSYDALRMFINYLYTAEACLEEQIACDLIVLAEKYQVKHLKAYCENFMVSKLNWDNSIVSFAFARQHNAKHLLDAALSLIMENMEKLTKREDYTQLVERDPQLLIEIYEAHLPKLLPHIFP
ncbi:BTB/POZ domain-containing protein At4g08455-like [Malania oleifera]|uniref:BTB/POZ domain-containing protein At4g08455-like n=1 Tax=Malania oleifera TaxID=397392 RepID=UPI0025AE66A2|nr:BTB/POZ domain-containing protein At4g08455-like [Malania oleifera]XP_057973577.1 BTB/POZ domain-containing protein At4g08455-like [Malania oleifera]XP_057973578.1 BTB/POZ domain-containing protein At4g08455-like [Malania oleifera]